jgi:predicted secreted protein
MASRQVLSAVAGMIVVAMLPSHGAAQATTTTVKMAEFGGAMQAGARACFAYNDDELRRLKQELKQQAIAAQMRAADFETVFQAGYVKARDRLAKATPAEKEKTCDQLAAIGGSRK